MGLFDPEKNLVPNSNEEVVQVNLARFIELLRGRLVDDEQVIEQSHEFPVLLSIGCSAELGSILFTRESVFEKWISERVQTSTDGIGMPYIAEQVLSLERDNQVDLFSEFELLFKIMKNKKPLNLLREIVIADGKIISRKFDYRHINDNDMHETINSSLVNQDIIDMFWKVTGMEDSPFLNGESIQVTNSFHQTLNKLGILYRYFESRISQSYHEFRNKNEGLLYDNSSKNRPDLDILNRKWTSTILPFKKIISFLSIIQELNGFEGVNTIEDLAKMLQQLLEQGENITNGIKMTEVINWPMLEYGKKYSREWKIVFIDRDDTSKSSEIRIHYANIVVPEYDIEADEIIHVNKPKPVLLLETVMLEQSGNGKKTFRFEIEGVEE